MLRIPPPEPAKPLAAAVLRFTSECLRVIIPWFTTPAPSPFGAWLWSTRLWFRTATLPLAMPHIRTGRLRPLAVGSKTRSPLLPELPTLNESGAPGYEFTVFWGIVAPAGTPAAIVKRLNAEFNAILSDPEAAKQLATEGAEVTPWTPVQFGALLADNVAMWKRVARDADIRAE